MEDWALIRRLVADGVPQRQVARDLGVGRSTVARAVASDRPPKYERPVVPTSFTAFEPLVRQLLITTPDMPATVLAERVGWTGSITWFRDNVRRLRPEHRPVDPSDRLTWLAGDAAQCDLWFPPRCASSFNDPNRHRVRTKRWCVRPLVGCLPGIAQRHVVRDGLVVTPGQPSRAAQAAGQVVCLQNLHDLLAGLHPAGPSRCTVIEISQPPDATGTRQRHGTSGEKPWPSVGRFRGHQRGDQLAAHGEIFMSAVTASGCKSSWS